MSALYEALCDLAAARKERNEAVSLWWKAEERQLRVACANAGECFYCGERLPLHEEDCRNAPEQDKQEQDE